MKLRICPAVMRVAVPAMINPLARTWRFRSRDHHHWQNLVDGGRPFIFVLWHEALLPLLWRHRQQDVAIVVSEATEGQYLAQYAERIGYRTVTGSSTRGGARALRGAIRALDDGRPVAFTPDGPRGPRRGVKPGVVRAAQRAGAMILPLHAVAESAWCLGSWDRMIVPKPFATIDLAYGEPFAVSEGSRGLETGISQCAAALAGVERTLTS